MKKYCLVLSAFILSTSCVSEAKYKELEYKYYTALQGESKSLEEVSKKEEALKALENQYSSLKELQEALIKKKTALDSEYAKLQEEYNAKLKDMEALKNRNAEISDTATTTAKDRDAVLSKLEDTKGELKEKIKRINELEGLIAQQRNTVSNLKDQLRNALKNYEGRGVTIEEKEGNVYISMDNKLLFPSGSWYVQEEGIFALNEIAHVLANEKGLNIVIEGHTDNVRFSGKDSIEDNWDLSVMRATSITKILQHNGVSPLQMTASGRSEYNPVASNDTATGRAMNRRVDIIIAPNLNEITKLLNEL